MKSQGCLDESLETAAARVKGKIRGRLGRLKKQVEELNNTLERGAKADTPRTIVTRSFNVGSAAGRDRAR
jgi:hypothetical protein